MTAALLALALLGCSSPELIDVFSPLTLAPGEVDTAFVYRGPGALLEWGCTDPELRITFAPDYIELFSVIPEGIEARLSVAVSTYATVGGDCTVTTPSGSDTVVVTLEEP